MRLPQAAIIRVAVRVEWACVDRGSRGFLAILLVGLANPASTGAFLHAHQLQAKVANLVKDAVQVGLIADLADEGGLFASRFQREPFEGGPEMLGQAAPDGDPVPGRLHVPSEVLRVDPSLGPGQVSSHHPPPISPG
jgi:hypothetical protein